MQMKISIVALVGLLGFGTIGCAGFGAAPVSPPPGLLYTSHQSIIDTDANETALGSKEGRATVSNILGLVSTGDSSVAAAARNGGITTIRHLDYERFNVLFVYSTFTTIVHGD